MFPLIDNSFPRSWVEKGLSEHLSLEMPGTFLKLNTIALQQFLVFQKLSSGVGWVENDCSKGLVERQWDLHGQDLWKCASSKPGTLGMHSSVILPKKTGGKQVWKKVYRGQRRYNWSINSTHLCAHAPKHSSLDADAEQNTHVGKASKQFTKIKTCNYEQRNVRKTNKQNPNNQPNTKTIRFKLQKPGFHKKNTPLS